MLTFHFLSGNELIEAETADEIVRAWYEMSWDRGEDIDSWRKREAHRCGIREEAVTPNTPNLDFLKAICVAQPRMFRLDQGSTIRTLAEKAPTPKRLA